MIDPSFMRARLGLLIAECSRNTHDFRKSRALECFEVPLDDIVSLVNDVNDCIEGHGGRETALVDMMCRTYITGLLKDIEIRPALRFLRDDQIIDILNRAYELLEDKGILLETDGMKEEDKNELLDGLMSKGCKIEKGRLKISGDVIDGCLMTAPSQIRLWNIEGTECYDMAGEGIVHFNPGSAAPLFLDYHTNRIRKANLKDMVDYTHIVDQLENIDFSSTAVVPSDVPEKIRDSIRLYALLKKTTKPIVTGAFSIEGFDIMRKLMLAVRGDEDELREKPFAIYSCCPSSPLRFPALSTDNTIKCGRDGTPVEFITMPMAGSVAPMSLYGCLIQHAAETLSGIVISQTANHSAPVFWGSSPVVYDMQTEMARMAAVEVQLLNCAITEIGKYLDIPTQAYMLSDSKRLDAQAGFEFGTGAFLSGLIGIDNSAGAGMGYSEALQSLEKLAYDDVICGMARSMERGIDDVDLPMELFNELVEQGQLLDSENTFKHFRDMALPRGITDNKRYDGADSQFLGLGDRAHDAVKQHLDSYQPPDVLSGEQRRALYEVMSKAAGDFELPF